MTDRYVGRIHFLAHDRPTPLPRSWATSPASEAIRHRQRVRDAVRVIGQSVVLLGLLFGVPLALGALAVAFGMDPLGGTR